MMRKTYKIPDMHCSNCAMKLESIEDHLPGIRSISASYHRQEMVVEFDEAQVTETHILAAIAEKGYHAEIRS